MYVLERIQRIPKPRDEVFAFFADAQNLEQMTPRWLAFQILTPRPIRMHEGTLIDYRIALFGIPMSWRTRIEAWQPDERFVDTQLRGPYRRWHHTHTFEAIDGGTLMLDRVEYALPLGPLGTIAHALFVRRQLDMIFEHRRATIEAVFGLWSHGG